MAAWTRGAWAILVVTLLGCEPPPESNPCPQVAFDQEILVPATDTTLPVDTRASPHTDAGLGYLSIDITDNLGTVEFWGSGPVPAFIYNRYQWSAIGYTLLSGLGVADGAWFPFWLYCAPDGTLDFFYGERTDRQGAFSVRAFGTCNEAAEIWSMPLALPAHTLRDVAMTCGFSVDTPPSDPALRLESATPGVAVRGGTPMTALVFSTVDCRGCSGGPWFELHSLLWEPSRGEVGFAIWYLSGLTSGTGTLAPSVLTLPAAKRTQLSYPTATWTVDE